MLFFEEENFKATEGEIYLGGFVGNLETKERWIQEKGINMDNLSKKFTEVTNTYPQSAFTGITSSLQHEWTYVQRVTQISGTSFLELDEELDNFIETLFGQVAPPREITSLPVKAGGLGIPTLSKKSTHNYNSSIIRTSTLINAIKNKNLLNLEVYNKEIKEMILSIVEGKIFLKEKGK